jgi:hypothetical protein
VGSIISRYDGKRKRSTRTKSTPRYQYHFDARST